MNGLKSSDDPLPSNARGVTIDVMDLSYSVLVNKTNKVLLRNINFNIAAGELTALMGPSGAGKPFQSIEYFGVIDLLHYD